MAKTDYVQFGESWEKEVKKHSKDSLIQLFKEVCIKNLRLEKKISELQKQESKP